MNMISPNRTTAILLAGGVGSRMGAPHPKQYLLLAGKPIIHYSFDLFLKMDEIDEIVVVCDAPFKYLFTSDTTKPIHFALPGSRRQDSVYNGLLACSKDSKTILIHDGARPFIDVSLVRRVLEAGIASGAATAAMPIKFTVKVGDGANFVTSTPDRSTLWEIQTPQVIERDVLKRGFDFAIANNITVTDDTTLAELIAHPVKLVEGSHTNIKITVPSDLVIANTLIPEPCQTTTN